MIEPVVLDRLTEVLPLLRKADPSLRREIQQTSAFVSIPAGRDIFSEGDRADAIALLISGVVRVYKIGETGREITLYRFGTGESCILTANAILSRQTFPAVATVEKDAQAVLIPAASFLEWVRRYDLWREFLFTLLSQRILSLMTIVEEVAFQRMDWRVAMLLARRARRKNPILMTHQEIAAELGSSREVISRILESLMREGYIQVRRGSIEVFDLESLENLALM